MWVARSVPVDLSCEGVDARTVHLVLVEGQRKVEKWGSEKVCSESVLRVCSWST